MFDAAGELLATAPTENAIYKIDKGQCTVAVRLPREGAAPVAWRYLPDGSVLGLDAVNGLFTANRNGGNVAYAGSRIVRDHFPGSAFKGLDDFVLDAEGGAYISDALGSSVLRPTGGIIYRAPTGELSEPISDGLAFPNGLVVSRDGKMLYVAEWNAARITAIPINSPGHVDVSRAYVFAYFPDGRGPDGMTMDVAGNIYAADWSGGGGVSIFTPYGLKIGAIHAPEVIEATNVVLHGGYIYVTTMAGASWRTAVTTRPYQRGN